MVYRVSVMVEKPLGSIIHIVIISFENTFVINNNSLYIKFLNKKNII